MKYSGKNSPKDWFDGSHIRERITKKTTDLSVPAPAKGSYFLLQGSIRGRRFMPKILVFYYSRTGRTERMANAVVEGAKATGNVEVALEYHIQVEDLSAFDAILVGAPTYHHEMPVGIKKLFEDAAEKQLNLKGKTGAAFGSYGWSGEAPKLVIEVMKYKFEMQVPEPPILARDEPTATVLKTCQDLGKRISEILIRGA